MLIGIPILGSIILMIALTWGLDFCWRKSGLKIHFLYSFAVSYFLISLALLYFQYQQPPSEYFAFPIIAGSMILSYPIGMIPFSIHVSGFFLDALVLFGGLIQWCLVAFFYQKLKQNNKSIWAVFFWLLALSIFGVLIIVIFKILFSR